MFLKKKTVIQKILITKHIEIYDRVINASAINGRPFCWFSAIDLASLKIKQLKYWNLRLKIISY